MRHLKDHRKLGRTTSHRKAMFRNMMTSLIECERIETTLPKAKELRRYADRMVTWGKKGTLHARRNALRYIRDAGTVQKLFSELATRFQDRSGGYTRIYRIGYRSGDNAPMAIIEYLGAPMRLPKKVKEKRPEAQARAPKKAKKPVVKAAKEEKKEKKVAKPSKPKKEVKAPAKKKEVKKAKEEKPTEERSKKKTGLLQRLRGRKTEKKS